MHRMVNQAPRLVVMAPISDDAILEGNIATRDELASKVCGLGGANEGEKSNRTIDKFSGGAIEGFMS